MKRRTKQIFVSGIVGVLLIGVWVFLQQKIRGSIGYTDSKGRFSINYPKTWENSKKKGGADAMFMTAQSGDIDLFRENLSVVVQNLGGNKPHNLSEYSFMAVDQITAVFGENIEIIENNPLWQLSGRAAHRLVFIGKGPQGEYKYLMVWALGPKKETAYQVTYAGIESQFDRYLEEAEKMIASFKIRN